MHAEQRIDAIDALREGSPEVVDGFEDGLALQVGEGDPAHQMAETWSSMPVAAPQSCTAASTGGLAAKRR